MPRQVQRSRPSSFRALRLVGVAVLFLGVVFLWISWMDRDHGLPTGDEYRYLAAADRARAVLLDPPAGLGKTLVALGDVHPTHPPLFAVVAGAAMHWLGPELRRLMAIQLLFLLVLLVAVYNAGRVLTSRRRGLAAAILVAGFPLTFTYTHEFFLELPTAAFVAWALWLLVAWRAYGGWGRALLLGGVIGLGLLTKWTFPVFVLVPALLLLDRLRRHHDFGAVQVWVGFLLGLVLALPWYVRHGESLVAFFRWNQVHAYWHLSDLGTPGGWLFYVERLPFMMGGLGSVLFVIGLVAALARPRREGVVLGGFLLPLVVFTAMGSKAFDGRHLLPALPAAALLAALPVAAPWAAVRIGAWVAVIAALPLNLLPTAGLGGRDTLRGLIPGTAYSLLGHYQEPERDSFGARRTYAHLRAAMRQHREARARVLVLAAYRSLGADGLGYLGRLESAPLEAFAPEPRASGERDPAESSLWEQVRDASYVVLKESLPVDSNLNGFRDALLAWAEFFRQPDDSALEPLPEVVAPDGDAIRIYRRTGRYSVRTCERLVRCHLRTLLGPEDRLDPDPPGLRGALEALAALRREQDDPRRAAALEDLVHLAIDVREDLATSLPARAAAVPEEPWIVLAASRALLAAGQARDAAALLEKRPRSTELERALLRQLAEAHRAQRHHAQAVQAWRLRARLDPDDAASWFALAEDLERMAEPDRDGAARAREIARLKARVRAAPGDRWMDALELGERLRDTERDQALFHLGQAVLAAPADSPASVAAFQAWQELMKAAGRTPEVAAFLRRRQSVEEDPARRRAMLELLQELDG